MFAEQVAASQSKKERSGLSLEELKRALVLLIIQVKKKAQGKDSRPLTGIAEQQELDSGNERPNTYKKNAEKLQILTEPLV